MSLESLGGEYIKPGDIAGLLEKIKKSLFKQAQGETPKVRATLSNFILLYRANCESEKKISIDNLLVEVARCHPSRFFVIQYDNALDESLKCSVRSRELNNSSGISLQTEEILISVGKKGLNLVTNLILSHLVPDIETVLVSPKSSEEDSEISELIFKLLPIVDSFICEAPNKSIDEQIRKNFVSVESKYLAWPRIARWRNAISEQFDSPYSLRALGNLKKINIDFTEAEVGEDALYLASWILDSLGYTIDRSPQVKNTSSYSISIKKDGANDSTIELSHVKKDGLCGIAKMRFTMNGDQGSDYVIESSYDSKEHSMEITTFGDHDSGNQKEHETCEFHVRKVNCEELSDPEIVVNLIRTSTIPNYSDTFLQLSSYVGNS